jgi:quercetin dioxygenase-like cupin family protein
LLESLPSVQLCSGADYVVAVPDVAPNRLAIRASIAGLEAAMFAATALQIHIEPVHQFAQGLYAREVTLPAGTIATGLIHGQEHICIISQGRVEVLTESGGARIIEAPATFVVPRGAKNCVRAVTDCVWTTIHATELRDVAAIEAAVTLPSFDALKLGDK